MRQPRGQVGRLMHDGPALGRQIGLGHLLHPRRHLARHQPVAHRDHRIRRDCAGRFRAHLAGADALHIQRRPHGAERQSIGAFAAAQAEFPLQAVFDRRQVRDGVLLGHGQRAHIVIEAGDQDASLIVAQAGDQARRHGGRIGRPVAVMSVMQRPQRTIDRRFKAGAAAGTEIQGQGARLVQRAIADQQQVGLQRVQMRAQGFGQMT